MSEARKKHGIGKWGGSGVQTLYYIRQNELDEKVVGNGDGGDEQVLPRIWVV